MLKDTLKNISQIIKLPFLFFGLLLIIAPTLYTLDKMGTFVDVPQIELKAPTGYQQTIKIQGHKNFEPYSLWMSKTMCPAMK